MLECLICGDGFVYDFMQFASIFLFLSLVIISIIATKKFKFAYMVYMTLGIALIAISAVFSALKYRFYPWEFALLEYVFFLLSVSCGFLIYFNVKKHKRFDDYGIPDGEKIAN